MNKNTTLIEQMLNCAERFAMENGFYSIRAKEFMRKNEGVNEWFLVDLSIEYGEGVFSPRVGIEVPEIDDLLKKFPGLERRWEPTFGGPLFRFVDLSRRKMHDYLIKFSSGEADQRAMKQLRDIWSEVAVQFFEKFSSSRHWHMEVRGFLDTGRVSALRLPCIGRTCVAIAAAFEDIVGARDTLIQLSVRGPNGGPVQDYTEAAELLDYLQAARNEILPLRKKVEQMSAGST
jgi:hypothetical protein